MFYVTDIVILVPCIYVCC